MENNKIVINRIFNGSYNYDNIGHEFINLLNPDYETKKRYLYICPYGIINKDYANPKYIIFVKTINSKKLKIVGISVKHNMVHEIYNDTNKNTDNIKKEYEKQCEECPKYLGIKLSKFFENQNNTLLYTFISEKFYKPKADESIYLIPRDNNQSSVSYSKIKNETFIKIEPIKKDSIVSQYQIKYYDDNSFCSTIQQVINNSFVPDNTSCEKLKNGSNGFHDQYTKSVLDTIKKTDDENVFSNWISSLINKNSTFCNDFINFLIEKYNFNKNTKYALKNNDLLRKIKREQSTTLNKKTVKDNETIHETIVKDNNSQKRIDLWIETSDYIIYIENKIKSGINGYVEDKHNLPNQKTQLSNYFNYATQYNKKNVTTKRRLFL